MQEERDRDLDRLIAAVASGEQIDWAAENARRPDLVPLLEQLRVTESISVYHREPQDTPDLPMPKWGPLQLMEKVGQGGVAEVFRAFDPRLRTEVALKLIRPGVGSEKRILEEGRRMARVRHPNVLVVHGVGRHAGRAGLWTDLIHGRTLEAALAVNGPFGADEAARVGLDLCRALAAVHAAGLVHRDVKTTNVMREQGGRIILMDFGASTERGPAQAGEAVEDGTPFTMAPEQLRGEPATPASDHYALGVLLYRLVTGRFPVEASTYGELHALHDRGERTPLRDLRADLPTAFVRAVERALEPRPEDRFASAGEFERALLDVVKGERAESRPRGGRRQLLTMLGVLLAVAAAAWWSFERMGADRRERARDGALVGTNPGEPQSVRPSPKAGQPTGGSVGVPGGRTAPGSLVASAALMVERRGRPQALAPGDLVAPGEGLSLKFQAEEPVHVYVLDEDAAGEVYVLFPTPGLELVNPLAPGRLHRLPGPRGGQDLSWQVTSAGGRETVIVIATRQPFEALEQEIAGFPRASLERPVAYGRMSESTLSTLRGIGGIIETESAVGPSSGRRLSEVIRRLRLSPDSVIPWTWQIELHNPRR